MLKKTKQSLALFLSLAIVASSLPAYAVEEASLSAKSEESSALMYRTHALGDDGWGDDDWTTYEILEKEQARQEEQAAEVVTDVMAPLDAIAIKWINEAGEEDAIRDEDATDADVVTEDGVSDASRLTYKVRDMEGSWSEDWVEEGESASATSGITGIQVQLNEDFDAKYDAWYRAKILAGPDAAEASWLEWVKDPSELVATDGDAFADFEIVLVPEGESAPSVDQEDVPETGTTDESDAAQSVEEVNEEEPANSDTVDAVATDDAATDKVTADEVPVSVPAEDASAAVVPTADVSATEESTTDTSAAAKATESSAKSDNKVSSGAAIGVESTTDTVASAPAVTGLAVQYHAYSQKTGWLDWGSNGVTVGNTEATPYLSAVEMSLANASGGIKYRTYSKKSGWGSWAKNGTTSGVTKKGKTNRVEAIRIKLGGEISKTHDVWYRVYAQSSGWTKWVKNGSTAGTTGKSKRMKALEVLLVKKGDTIPASTVSGAKYKNTASTVTSFGVRYQSYLKSSGWYKEVANGKVSGSTKKKQRVQAVRIRLSGATGGIKYRTKMKSGKWSSWAKNGAVSGSTKSAQLMKGIQVKLTGAVSKTHDVWYRVYTSSKGWTSWVKNGKTAGNSGEAIVAVEVMLSEKNSLPPASQQSLNGVDISGWDEGIKINNLDADFVIIKATEGVTGNLSNPAYYNPSYKKWANQAIANGKLIGFYHYANGGDPIKEADWFYYAIKDYKGKCIACLDWEGAGNKKFETGKDVKWCKKFLDRLASKMGGTPFIYMSKNVTREYDWSSVAASYPLWGAEYPDYKKVRGYQSNPWQSSKAWGAWGAKPTIFQYTSTGVLTKNGGIDYFDFNLFYGSTSKWLAYQS